MDCSLGGVYRQALMELGLFAVVGEE